MLLESVLSGKDSLCVLSQLVLLRYKTVWKKECNYSKFSSERKRNRRKEKKQITWLSLLCFCCRSFQGDTCEWLFCRLKYVMKYRHHEKPWCISVLVSVINGSSGMVEWCLCIITIHSRSLLPHQGEESKLLMLDLKHNVFSLSVTGAHSFICFPLPPDETVI